MNTTAKSYTLRTGSGDWLGQIVLTSDGGFMSITDWGNLCYAWRAYGKGDFREFLCGINTEYFAGKLMMDFGYFGIRNKKNEASVMRFAEKILPALKKVLIEELENEKQKP